MITTIKKVLNKGGFDLYRYPTRDIRRRLKLFKTFNIDTVLDIGANKGQYGSLLLDLNFDGKIISFEPLSSAYKQLALISRKHENWHSENIAIGDIDGEIEINISENSHSSSILDMLSSHLEASPGSRYINKEKATIRKLDTIHAKYIKSGDNVFLKIDTQGYEKNVLDGAENCLHKVTGIQLEMAMVPLYNSEILFQDMLLHLQSKGFNLYSLETGFSSPTTGRLLQVDGIFFKD